MPINDRLCLEIGYGFLPFLVQDFSYLTSAVIEVAILIPILLTSEVLVFDFQPEGFFFPLYSVS